MYEKKVNLYFQFLFMNALSGHSNLFFGSKTNT